MTLPSKNTLIKTLFTPQVLLAFLLCSVLAFRYFKQQIIPIQTGTATVLATESIEALVSNDYELVLYDSNQLQQAKFVSLESQDKPSAKISSLINALKNEYLGIWPESLGINSIFEVSSDGSSLIVLDFNYEQDKTISINDEWRLLKSLKGTLNRAGYPDIKILINQKESEVFLNFIKLD